MTRSRTERNRPCNMPFSSIKAPTSSPPAPILKKRKAFWASFVPYMKALPNAGIVVAGAGLRAAGRRDVDEAERRQAAGAGRPVRRNQGTARRLLHHRCSQSRRGARMGGALSGRARRRRRGAAGPAAGGSRDDVAQAAGASAAETASRNSADGRVSEAVERAARRSYGRLLAFLAARSRDIAAAEDCAGRRVRRGAHRAGRATAFPTIPRPGC